MNTEIKYVGDDIASSRKQKINKIRRGWACLIPLKIIISAVIIFSAVFSYAAFRIPESPQNYVSDYAGVLHPIQKDSLNAVLKNFDVKTTNQIFAAVFESLEGESLEDVSIRIAQKWSPGVKDKDNGVLLLIFLRDRKIRIEVGYGLEAVLTDVLANALITNEIAPKFRDDDYYAGIENAVFQMIKILSGDISADELKAYESQGAITGKKSNRIAALLFFVIFIIIFIRHPFLTLLLFSGGFSSGGRYSGGGGFGGGGGGSFGGGGASGGW